MNLVKYQDWKKKNPNFYSTNGYDALFEKLCDEWFQFRYLGDTEERFSVYFKRTIDNNYDKYLEQLKIDTMRNTYKLDYFVYNYDEHWHYIKNTGTTKGTNESSSNGGDVTTIEKDGKNDTNSTLNNTSNATNEATSVTTNTGTQKTKTSSDSTNETSSEDSYTAHNMSSVNTQNDTVTKNIQSSLPNSISNESGDFNEAFSWKTASGKAEQQNNNYTATDTGENNENSSSSSSTSTLEAEDNTTRTDDLTATTKDNAENNSTSQSVGVNNSTYEDKEKQTRTNNATNTATNNTSTTNETTDLNINTGRSGKNASDVLSEAYNFIRSYCTWDWMYAQLNICFFGLFIDEDEVN